MFTEDLSKNAMRRNVVQSRQLGQLLFNYELLTRKLVAVIKAP